MQIAIIILFVVNILSYIILAIIFKKKYRQKYPKEILKIYDALNKLIDHQDVFIKIQESCFTSLKYLSSETRLIKNELASTQCYLMDKVINGEER